MIQKFLNRLAFNIRFTKKSLGLNVKNLEAGVYDFQKGEKLELLTLFTTAFARYTLFKTLSCEPLTPAAAKSFLDVVFLANIFPDEGKIVDEEKLNSFEDALLGTPMAWTDSDREMLKELLLECTANLEGQFGGLNLSRSIQWKYTKGLLIDLGL